MMTKKPSVDEMLDDIFNKAFSHAPDPEQITVEIGIWQTEETPFTFFALLYDNRTNPRTIVAGESSYGADSIQEAIQDLKKEVDELEDWK